MYSIIFSLVLGWLSVQELLIVGAIILLLFGGRKLPELMRGLGKGIREFNAAKANVRNEVEEGLRAEERKASEPQKMNDNSKDSANDSPEA